MLEQNLTCRVCLYVACSKIQGEFVVIEQIQASFQLSQTASHALKFVTHAAVKLHGGFGYWEGAIEGRGIQSSLWTSPTF